MRVAMDRATFEGLVSQALEELPEQFLNKLENVDLVVESWPSKQTLTSLGMRAGGLLFGLYQGVPKTKRTGSTLLPDKITIFAGPILLVCKNELEVKDKVAEVVRHEIAHHFGLSERSIRKTGH